MEGYKTKAERLTGTHWRQVSKRALAFYDSIRKRTKRRPYVRSAFFSGEKVFLDLFWHHLHEKKNIGDKTRRLKYFVCAIELIQHSRIQPSTKMNPNRKSETLYRFAGITPNKHVFHVQIKKDKKGEKSFISVFPHV